MMLAPPSPAEYRPRAHRRLHGAIGVIALALAFASAGCGSSGSSGGDGTSTHVHFAKTKFVLHAGLAFGAFHRYIYKPFRGGGFTPPLQHKSAIVKAGVAALFVYHEVKIALVDARSSPLLSKLVTPLTALQSKLTGLYHSLTAGHLDSGAIDTVNSSVSSIRSQSAHSGATIRELATSRLG
jgi:hypothetical protein